MTTKLEAAGLTCREWYGYEARLYVSEGSRGLGYLLETDDGTTGTCKGMTRRAGYVAELLRGE